MKPKYVFSVLAALLLCVTLSAQDLKAFKLNNGMSVFVWEDHSSPEVFGAVVVKAGSCDDPEEYTGLAHYLEHVMFKGTSKIGALEWEKEKPIYEQIIAKYDEKAMAATKEEKEAINKEINRLSIEESKLTVANEYANLIEGIGGSGLNAATSYDMTFYHNSFPSNETAKWLQLASERFLNPVFRGFQSELETVYEEYNMYMDDPSTLDRNFFFGKIFDGSPYARDVIGLGDHLKNPRLSKLIQFYKDWYVANNMALILVGDVDTKSIIRLVNATFGKIAPGTVRERPEYGAFSVKGRKIYSSKHSRYPSVMMAYDGVGSKHPDEIPLEVCVGLLTNANNTGLLDRLVVSGDLLASSAALLPFRDMGRIIVTAVPFYDEAQRMFEPNKKVLGILDKALGKLSSGEFDDWLIEAVKVSMCRDFDLGLEGNIEKGQFLLSAFADGRDLNEALRYKDKVMSVTVDDVKRVARQYFNSNNIVVFNDQGDPAKSEKITKPEIDPITPAQSVSSQYAEWFRGVTAPELKEEYLDWTAVQERQINSYSRLYYTKNTKNDVFTLVLKYGANRNDFPKLAYAADLMDNAGIMNAFKSAALKEEFSRLGATYSISADDSYMYVTLRGYETNLEESCKLLTRLMLIPDLDSKQLDNLKGGALSSRSIRKKDVNSLASALRQYVMYGDESPFRKELTDKELVNLDISSLTGNVIDAIKYAAEIHYSGSMPFEDAFRILSSSLPLVEGERPTTSPLVRPLKDYTENTVFFLPNTQAQQSQIFFYIPMGKFNREESVVSDAFSRYIGGGFNGVIMREVREYNSMAYTASGNVSSTGLPESGRCFIGYVGTQNDKAMDAIRLYVDIIRNLPEHPESLSGIKSFLMQDALASQPDERDLSSYIAGWRLRGYKEDPSVERVPKIKALEYGDIMAFYRKYIKDQPLIIGVAGNPKDIQVSELAKFGKVVRLHDNQLFNEKDVLF